MPNYFLKWPYQLTLSPKTYEAYFPATSYQKYGLLSTRLHTRWYLMVVLVCIFLVLSELLGGLFPPDTSDLHGQFYHLKGKQQREHQAIITVWRNSFKARWNKSFILPSFKKAGDQTGHKHSATVLTTLWLLLRVQFWSCMYVDQQITAGTALTTLDSHTSAREKRN